MSLPSSFLDAPYPTEVMPAAVTAAVHWPDFLSPSHVVVGLIASVTGFNPFEWVAEKVAGDWQGYGVAEAAVRQLSEYVAALAADVDAVASALDVAWDGQASDAAITHFSTSAVTISGAQKPLTGIAEELRLLKATVNQTASTLVSIEEAIIDKGIEMAIKAAAGGATAETVIGPIIFAGMAVNDAIEMAKLCTKLKEVWGLMMLGVDVTAAAVMGLTRTLHDDVTVSLAAYHHPGVK